MLRQQLAAEQQKLQTLQAETGERLEQLQAEVESLRTAREEAAAAVSPGPARPSSALPSTTRAKPCQRHRQARPPPRGIPLHRLQHVAGH